MTAPGPRRGRLPTGTAAAALTALAVVIFVARALPHLDTAVDDAWISARYARNLALGHGLVYNAGEPAVEGYTNLAFVVWTALLWALGADMHGAMVLSGLSFAGVAVVAATLLTRALRDAQGPVRPVDAVPSLLLAVDPHVAVVATNGLESSQWIAGVLLATLVVVRPPRGAWRVAAGALVALVVAIRPEGLAVAAVLALYDVGARLTSDRRRWKDPATWIVAMSVAVAVVLVWGGRWLYFGELVPNTFAAKGEGGFTRHFPWNLKYLAPDRGYWLAAAAVGVVGTAVGLFQPRRLLVASLAVGLVGVAFSVEMWMPGGRLLLVAVALAACLAGAALAALPLPVRIVAPLLLAVPLLHGPVPAHVFASDRAHSALPGNSASRAARFVARHVPAGSTLLVRDAGVFAYHVGPDVRVVETHPRALTVPHPDGREVRVSEVAPAHPEIVVITVRGARDARGPYSEERLFLQRQDVAYDYLGRVFQHPNRHYDVHVRADLDVPPLPARLVRNHLGRLP